MQPIYKQFVAGWREGRSWEALRDRYIRPNEELLRQFYCNFVYSGPDGDLEADYRRYWAERPDRVDELLVRLAAVEGQGAPSASGDGPRDGLGAGSADSGPGSGDESNDSWRDGLGGRFLDNTVRRTVDRVRGGLRARSGIDVVALIGLGTTNACQLIHRGTPTVVLALDAWGRTFFDTPLPWSDIPLWLSHELAHVIRYAEGQSGFIDYIENGSLNYSGAIDGLPLLEFLIDEGLAVAAARHFGILRDRTPERGGGAVDRKQNGEKTANRIDAHALGFTDEQLAWCRSHEAELWQELAPRLHKPLTMDGYSRYFSFGADDIPPRTGYYIGLRLLERWLERARGMAGGAASPLAKMVRLSAAEFV